MKRFLGSILTIAAMVAVGSCSRSPLLVGNSVDITQNPTVVRFVQPVPRSDALWEMCFEFDPPGHSHHADKIYAVLLTQTGERRPLVDIELDRRGESLVCQMGRTDAYEPGSRIVPEEDEIVFEAVELSATVNMRVRHIRGGSVS